MLKQSDGQRREKLLPGHRGYDEWIIHNGPAVEQVFVLAGLSAHHTRANQPEAQAFYLGS
jgi:hypothetical protein